MKTETKAREKYFQEVFKCLHREGFEVTQPTADILDIRWQGHDLCHLTDIGSTSYDPNDLTTPELMDAEHQVYDIAKTVEQYLNEMETAPFLKVKGVEKFKILVDFHGTVFAGQETEQGVQFATWLWDYGRRGVSLGHYFGNDYEGAKMDFAIRSGLVDRTRVFTDEQLSEIASCCGDVLSGEYDLTEQQYNMIEDIQEQLLCVLPEGAAPIHRKMSPLDFEIE